MSLGATLRLHKGMGCMITIQRDHHCIQLDGLGVVRLNQILCVVPGNPISTIVFLPQGCGDPQITKWPILPESMGRLIGQMSSMKSARFCEGPHGSWWMTPSLQFVTSDSTTQFSYAYNAPVGISGVLTVPDLDPPEDQEVSIDLPLLPNRN